MALIVEDGTMPAGANSYVTLAQATTYHDDMGNAAWAAEASSAVKTSKLLKACQQMEARYRTRWKGAKKTATQRLSWPRKLVTDEDGNKLDESTVPSLVLDAQCEIALLLLAGSEFIRNEVGASESSVTSESVGPISISYGGGAGTTQSSYPLIDQMLETLAATAGTKYTINIGLTAGELEDMANDQFDPADWPEFFNSP